MKQILTILFVLLITAAAQAQKKTFVRIFDQVGSKIHKGFLYSTSNSSLTILQNKKEVEIPISQIGIIKLKRSFGHTLLISSLIGGVSFALIVAATADPDSWLFAYSAGEGALAGLVGGAAIGLITGGIVGGTTNRPVFIVNGKPDPSG